MEEQKVIVLECFGSSDFEYKCNNLVADGYRITTAIINPRGSAEYALGIGFQAILAKPEALAGYINETEKKIKINKFIDFFGGAFQLGETAKSVEVKPFAMSIYPVTNREYEEFDPSHHKQRNEYSDQGNQPVVNVSWDDAVHYCQWMSEKTGENYRLPTEAEWEFAASGGGQRQYPWGNEEPGPKRANYNKSKIGKTTPVGSYPLGATPEGLFDMAGNVWEWCDDWYDERRGGHVVRGGSFDNYRLNLRCAARYWFYPSYRNVNWGFRVVRGPSS